MALVTRDTAQSYWQRVMLYGSLMPAGGTPADFERMLEAYYSNNGLYSQIQALLVDQGIWVEGMLPLRNPAKRVVDFYIAKLWPGTLPAGLPLVTDNDAIRDAIERVWTWSNWSANKQVAALWFSLYGNWFCKVVSRRDGSTGRPKSIYLQNIRSRNVTDFKLDERGYLVYIRIDVETTDQAGKRVVHVEEWDKSTQLMRVWRHVGSVGDKIGSLGSPISQTSFQEYGIDFIPIVHAKLRDIGEPRGVGAFALALDKIDEANRMATRLHQLLFRYNKPTVGIFANATDSMGRPLPPPRMSDTVGSTSVDITDDDIREFPGHSRMEHLVAPIQYGAHLQVLQDHMGELELDLPELVYYRIKDRNDLSGRAMRTMLSGAVDRIQEARGQAESALIRAQQMALTLGIKNGLFPASLGSYESGSFDHSFEEREVVPASELEDAEVAIKETELVQGWLKSGLTLKTILGMINWDEKDIVDALEAIKEQKAEDGRTLAQLLLDAERKRTQEEPA